MDTGNDKSGGADTGSAHLGAADTEVSHRGSTPGTFDTSPDAVSPGEQRFVRGDELAHFIVVGELGVGGMGVVYAAYDPQLDRKVAIKLLRSDRDETSASGRKRLLREAQAMAQLAHENVVTVHEVGEMDGRVYVAMEYVDGGTLRDWTQAEDRSWHEVVRMYVRAGRGLAAAHSAGLVHRDFKPENVLVGTDGRVRVTDFGLVGQADEHAPEKPRVIGRGRMPTAVPLSATLTEHGTVLGTPGFIAPEVYDGMRGTALSDQFSFCVALYGALFARHPFEGETQAEVVVAVLSGRLRDKSPESEVPDWLHELLTRGMATDAAQRHGSMDELLDVLSIDRPARRRRRLMWAVGIGSALVATAVVFAALTTRASGPAPCSGADEQIAEVWGAAHRAKLATAFGATKMPFAADAAKTASRIFDRYATQWSTMHTSTCRKTRVLGEQSEALMDLRMRCLGRRREEFRVLLDVLTDGPSAKVVRSSGAAAARLVAVSACADTDALSAIIPPPEREDLRARVAKLEALLRRVTALSNAEEPRKALALATDLATRSRAVEWPHIAARALFWLGVVQDQMSQSKAAETSLAAALPLAAKARDDHLVALIYSRQLRIIGHDEASFERAMQLRPAVEAALARAGDPPRLRAGYLRSVGAVYDAKGRYREALRMYRRAYRLQVQVTGHESGASGALNDIAVMLDLLGEKKEALATYRRVLALDTKRYGPRHPSVARTLNNMAIMFGDTERYDEALRYYRRALVVWRGTLGADNSRVAIALVNMAVALQGIKNYAGAASRYHEALAIWKTSKGRQRAHVATVLNNLGDLYETQNQCKKAIPYYVRALQTYTEVYGADHVDSSYPLLGLGSCLAITGDVAQAIDRAELALRLRLRHKVDQVDVAEAEFVLARALWHRPSRRPRARLLARSAVKRFRAASGQHAGIYRALIAWTTKHRIKLPPPHAAAPRPTSP